MRRGGFTLIELLISLTLFGAVTALLFEGYFQFQGQSSRMSKTIHLRQELRNLESLIRADLTEAVYLENYAKGAEGEIRPSGILAMDLMEGGFNRDQLHLQVHSRGQFFTGFKLAYNPELFEVSYYFETNPQTGLGFYRREAYFIDGPLDEGGDAIVHQLSKRLTQMNLTFFDDQNQPQKDWPGKGGLPLGVEVELTLEGEDGTSQTSHFVINLRPAMGPGVRF